MKLAERAKRVIPGCSQTFSKGPTQFVQGVLPTFIERGEGSYVWDVDGNKYIDYPTALGPIILGHNDPDVNAAVERQMAKGVIFSLPHPLEVEVAEKLVELIPCAEMVRFGKNGSDVTTAAVRAARAYTGRVKIACCGYHGWHDWYIGSTTRNHGVPQPTRDLTLTFTYNDITSLERLFEENPGQIACVIMEPVGFVEPINNFLHDIAHLTRKNGALLIFDEVVTGFRIALGGAQEYYGVEPDLGCFNKAMANGFPVSAVVGPGEIMKIFEEVFFSVTFGGETLSLAAAQATLEKLESHNVIEQLWQKGKKLQDGYNAIAQEYGLKQFTNCQGLAPRTAVSFRDREGVDDLALKSLFQQEMAKRGILFLAGFNINFSLSEQDIEYTLQACREVLSIISRALEENAVQKYLEGPQVQAVFRQA